MARCGPSRPAARRARRARPASPSTRWSRRIAVRRDDCRIPRRENLRLVGDLIKRRLVLARLGVHGVLVHYPVFHDYRKALGEGLLGNLLLLGAFRGRRVRGEACRPIGRKLRVAAPRRTQLRLRSPLRRRSG